MKKLLALLLAVLSGLYLLLWVPTIDPIPFIDEGLAALVFFYALSLLGIELPNAFKKKEPVPIPVRSERR